MKYKDFSGKYYTEDNLQDRLLRKIYTSLWGRILIRPLITPLFSRAVGVFLDTSLSKVLIKPFIEMNQIDMKPYVKREYQSYNDFFTREIKPEERMIDYDETHLISPSDGKVSVYDLAHTGSFMVKHTQYDLESLLRSKKLAAKYQDSYALIIRLTVDNYHRYCYPTAGVKGPNHTIPGVFHTVNPIACETLPVYKENTREYTQLRSQRFGDVLLMEVGALMVGRIRNYHQQMRIKKGQEKGRFEFGGSTIIMVVDKKKVTLRDGMLENTARGFETIVRMGEWLCQEKTLDK